MKRREHSCHGHGHGHGHNHTGEKPLFSKLEQKLMVWGNAAIGAGEVALGNWSTLSVLVNGLHDGGDTAGYYFQTNNLDPRYTAAQKARWRKVSHWIIAANSAGAGALAAYHLAANHENIGHHAAGPVAGMSLALSVFLASRLEIAKRRRRKQKQVLNTHEHDIAKHIWLVDVPSAGLAVGGAWLQKYNVDVEQAIAVASGALGAYVFRPTRRNLEHDCLRSVLGATQPAQRARAVSAPAKEMASQGDRRSLGRWRKVGLAALAVLGCTTAAADAYTPEGYAPLTATPPAASHVGIGGGRSLEAELKVLDSLERKPPTATMPSLTECFTIRGGDSQWSIAEQKIESFTGRQAFARETQAITQFTILHNKDVLSDPDLIYPNTCLQVPTETMMASMLSRA